MRKSKERTPRGLQELQTKIDEPNTCLNLIGGGIHFQFYCLTDFGNFKSIKLEKTYFVKK